MVGDFGWEHEGRKSRVGTVKSYHKIQIDPKRLTSAVSVTFIADNAVLGKVKPSYVYPVPLLG